MATRPCGFDLPDHNGNRPDFAPETLEQSVSKRGESDKRALYSLGFFAERSLHTGEVVGSIPTAPTSLRCFAATAGKPACAPSWRSSEGCPSKPAGRRRAEKHEVHLFAAKHRFSGRNLHWTDRRFTRSFQFTQRGTLTPYS